MNTHRIFRLTLDLTDQERQHLAEAAALTGERFVDFVRRVALESATERYLEAGLGKQRLA